MNDPDPIGPDGSVRLRAYLPLTGSHYFGARCAGQGNCGHVAPIGVPASIRIMGTGEATVRQLARRLRCGRCGNRRIGVVLCSDPRPAWTRERGGGRRRKRGRTHTKAAGSREARSPIGFGGRYPRPALRNAPMACFGAPHSRRRVHVLTPQIQWVILSETLRKQHVATHFHLVSDEGACEKSCALGCKLSSRAKRERGGRGTLSQVYRPVFSEGLGCHPSPQLIQPPRTVAARTIASGGRTMTTTSFPIETEIVILGASCWLHRRPLPRHPARGGWRRRNSS